MISPQSATSTRSTADDTSLALKLKESCDDCSASKVKCTREKPACQRCARRGRACLYAASRRNGRVRPATPPPQPTAASPSYNIQSSAPQNDKNNDASLNFVSPDHMLNPSANDNWFSNPGLISPPASFVPHWTEFDFSGDLGLINGAESSGTRIDGAPGNDGPLMAGFDMTSNTCMVDFTSIACEGSATSSPGIAPVAQMLPPQQERPSNVHESSRREPQQDDCLARATELLLSLFPRMDSPDFTCLPLDTVLEQNRRAINTAITVMECSCKKDQYLIHVLGLVLLKAIAWYAAIVQGPAGSPSAGKAPTHARPRHDSALGDAVPREQVIQGHRSEDGRKAAQSVMSELHYVQRLLKLFGSRLGVSTQPSETCSISSGNFYGASTSSYSNSNAAGSDSPQSVSEQLLTEIRARFRAVSNDTIRRLHIT